MQYKELVATKLKLDESSLEPSAGVVSNILHYARGLQEKQ